MPPNVISMQDYALQKSNKGGPYIGPRGGRWADSKHTIPWRPGSKKAHHQVAAQHLQDTEHLGEALSTLMESASEMPILYTRHGNVSTQKVIDALESYRPNKPPKGKTITVHHSTDRVTADRLMKEGFIPQAKPSNLARARYEVGEYAEFAPGRGVSGGLYVGSGKGGGDTSGFGSVTLSIDVPEEWLHSSPEQKVLGSYDPKEALETEDGAVIHEAIHPSAIRELKKSEVLSMSPNIISMQEYALQKARKLQGRRTFQGLEISVENKAGSYRRWYDRFEKKEGKTKQHYDYGYIKGTLGTDGDHVDVYVGPNDAAQYVYVIDQMKGPEFREFDEQKVMMGFDSDTEARTAYLKHFDKPGFFGSIKPMEVGDFRRCVLNKENHGLPIEKALRATLVKGQMYIGPRGGKWADAKHTIPYKETGGSYRPISRDAAVTKVISGIRQGDRAGWLRNADRAYKDRIAHAIAGDAALRNATLNIFHQQHQIATGKKTDFAEFLRTPITLYRAGKTPASESFSSYSYGLETAQQFGDKVEKISVLPTATYGMINEMAEGEVLVPRHGDISDKFKPGATVQVQGKSYKVTAYEGGKVTLAMPNGKPVTMDATKLGKLMKSQMYIGPRGGKWANPQHTIPYKESDYESSKTAMSAGELLARKIKRRMHGFGAEVQLTKSELSSILSTGRFALVSAGPNPELESDRGMTDKDARKRRLELKGKLIQAGYMHTPVVGHYGGREDSFLVMIHDAQRDDVRALGKMFKQDSVIYVHGGQNELHFTHGPNADKNLCAEGKSWQAQPEAKDFYTKVSHPDGSSSKFSLNLDFENLKPCKKSFTFGALGKSILNLDVELSSSKLHPPIYFEKAQRPPNGYAKAPHSLGKTTRAPGRKEAPKPKK